MTSLLTRISTINFLMRRIRIGEGLSPILILLKSVFKVKSVVLTLSDCKKCKSINLTMKIMHFVFKTQTILHIFVVFQMSKKFI